MKNTLTEIIAGKLLDAAGNSTELEAVMTEYGSSSKGPYYNALAQATTILSQKLTALGQQLNGADKQHQKLQQQVELANQKLSELNAAVDAKEKQSTALKEEIQAEKAALEPAAKLAGMGFGQEELIKLCDILTQASTSQGLGPKQAIPLFFELAGNYQSLMSLKQEIKASAVALSKAKADAEYWQTEAKAAESKCKLRKLAIDTAEKLVGLGVKETDLPHWMKILSKAGVTTDGLAEALEEFASIEELCQDNLLQENELEHHIVELKAQIDTLTNERDGVIASIQTVREKAITEIGKTSAKVLEGLNGFLQLAAQVGELERQAASLRPEVTLARAIKNPDLELLNTVSRETVRELITALVKWCSASPENNPKLPHPPQFINEKGLYIDLTMINKSVTFEEALIWARSGLYTDKERQTFKL